MRIPYQAFDQSGKSVADTIEVADVAEAKETLRRQGLYVTQVGTRSLSPNTVFRRQAGRIRHLKNITMFARQLQVLLSSGTRVVEALESLEQQVKESEWRRVVGDIRRRVEQGASMSEAVKAHPQHFDPISRHMIAAGESTGKMPEMLGRVEKLTRKQMQVRNALVGAMIYPCLLIVVAICVLGAMLFFVLPRFAILFQTLSVPMPPSTQMMMTLSELLRGHWLTLLIGLVGVAVGFGAWIGSQSGKKCFDSAVLRVPYIGQVVRNLATARIARLLGIMLDSYMPLLDVLALIRETMTNHRYVKLLERAEDVVTRGEAISSAFGSSDLISPTVCQVVRSGEQSGQIGPLILNLADLMDEENDILIKSFTSIIEPVILIGLGLLVGFVTVSMFMPLFDLSAGPSGG